MTLDEEIQESMRAINKCCREVIRLSIELRELLGVKK